MENGSIAIIKALCAEIEMLSQQLEEKSVPAAAMDVRTYMSPAHRIVLEKLAEGKLQVDAVRASGLSTATVSRMSYIYADLIDAMKRENEIENQE